MSVFVCKLAARALQAYSKHYLEDRSSNDHQGVKEVQICVYDVSLAEIKAESLTTHELLVSS